MRDAFFKLFIVIVVMFSLSVKAEIFYLKNGEKLTGSLTGEDDKYYYLHLKIGETKLLKEKVAKVEKEQKTRTVLDDFESIAKAASSVDEILEAVDFGLKNDLEGKAIILLKRLYQKNLKEADLVKIKDIEDFLIEKKIRQARSNLKINNYSQVIDVLNVLKTFNFNLSKYVEEIQQLREEAYKEIMSEKETIKLLESIVNKFPYYQVYPKNKSKIKRKSVIRKSKTKDLGVENKNKLYESMLKLDPFFNQIKIKLKTHLEFDAYIKKNSFEYYSSIPVHSRKEINTARRIPSEFRFIVKENDKIYKARKLCNKFNYNTKKIKRMIVLLKNNLVKDDLYWSKRGYEKKLGEWIKRKQVSLKPVKIKLYDSLKQKEPEKTVPPVLIKKESLEDQLIGRNREVITKFKKA